MNTNDHERVTRWLRAGDPARDDGMTAMERTRLRSAALAEVPAERPGFGWGWVLAPAALAALAIVLAVIPEPPRTERTVVVTAAVGPWAEPVAATPRAEWPAPPPVPRSTVDTATRAAAVPPPSDASPTLSPRPVVAEDRSAPRTIRFDTGRTRVIWILDPSFEVGSSRGAAR